MMKFVGCISFKFLKETKYFQFFFYQYFYKKIIYFYKNTYIIIKIKIKKDIKFFKSVYHKPFIYARALIYLKMNN
jgi:hypothetical protein